MTLILLVAACATGGMPAQNADDDDDVVDPPADAPAQMIDGSQVTTDAPVTMIDAGPPPLDAFVFLDAPPPPPDAGSPLFCTANNQCTLPDQCCIRLGGPMGFCGDGIPIGSECFPQ